MAGNKPVLADSVVRRTRRRVKFHAVVAGLRIIFTFLVLAAIAGFGYGMWAEVAASPVKYAKRRSANNINYLEHWSVRTGILIATMQGLKTEYSMPRNELAKVEHTEPPVRPEPELPDTLKPRQYPIPPKPAHDDPLDLNPRPELKPTPESPPRPTPQPPRPRPRPGMDAKTAELLKKARYERSKALKCYKLAGPTAPSRGRVAATKLTLKHLKRARRFYGDAMGRKMNKSDRRRASAELSEVQRLMFWCHKFLPAGS